MREVFGNTIGLKPNQIYRLRKIYRRKINPFQIITPELSLYLLEVSHEINRQVGVLINRNGYIDYVVVGDFHKIFLPDFGRLRAGEGRFRGIRFIHTHLKKETFSRDDLTDLAILRLDSIAYLYFEDNQRDPKISIAYLLPKNSRDKLWHISEPCSIHNLRLNFIEFIEDLEKQFVKYLVPIKKGFLPERAVLVFVSERYNQDEVEEFLNELKELANTAGVEVVDSIIQYRKKIDPKYIMGRGKLEEAIIRSIQHNASLLIFNKNITPAQAKAITEITDLKVIDRTQLILDIFAQRAQSRDGKIQVELAQLKYRLPRLTYKDDSLSRLTGGIGGRGPGETKLEINKRRIRERIVYLESKLKDISKNRRLQRKSRLESKIPIVAIIGYTNAGKSTLINALTKSKEYTDNKLFATLDPHARILNLPLDKNGEFENSPLNIILVDTVGFIKDLPQDLLNAFKATLEELKEADLFIHLVDGSNKRYREKIEAVEEILTSLGLNNIPQILVINKMDKIEGLKKEKFLKDKSQVTISALTGEGINKLKQRLSQELIPKRKVKDTIY